MYGAVILQCLPAAGHASHSMCDRGLHNTTWLGFQIRGSEAPLRHGPSCLLCSPVQQHAYGMLLSQSDRQRIVAAGHKIL